MIKKGDIAVIAIITAAAIILALTVFKSGGKYVTVTMGGKEYGKYSLQENQTVKIRSELGQNQLVIKNGKAYFTHSDCPDKTCQKQGEICDEGETIVCLPHKVVAEVTK